MEFSAFMLPLGPLSRWKSPFPHFTAVRAATEWSLGVAKGRPVEVGPGCAEMCVGSKDVCACDDGLGRGMWHSSRASRDAMPCV